MALEVSPASHEPVREPVNPADHREVAPLYVKIVSLLGVLLPFAGFIVAIALLWGRGFGWIHGGLLLGMYVITAMGVTIGYHRYFCHRSFKTHRVVQWVLGICGSMAVEGPVLKWVAMHRCHHQHSDGSLDPHSPHGHGDGPMGVLKGMWHAHIGWIFEGNPKNLARYVPDLADDRVARFTSATWWFWSAVGMLIPAAIAGLVTRTWLGALEGFLWGGLARTFLVHHMTWSINSICHTWGTKPFRSHDESRNNFVFGVIGFGEGWHNNHHAFPASARHGLRWWELDLSYYVIRALELVGLAQDVKVPNRDRLLDKRAAA